MNSDEARAIWRVPGVHRLDEIALASKTICFVEEFDPRYGFNGNSFIIKSANANATELESWVDVPAHFHISGSNVIFADGHGEYWTYADERTSQLKNPAVNNAGSADLKRFQDVAGYK